MNTDLLNTVLESTKHHVTIIPASLLNGRHFPPFFSNQNALLTDFVKKEDLVFAFELLAKNYPADHALLFFKQGADRKESFIKFEMTLQDARSRGPQDGVIAVLVPAKTDKNSFLDFLELIAHLRAPEGCPWDREQTHQSLRPNLLEETYEVLQTLDSHDMIGLQEELGDLLLQIVLHAQIASENRDFNIEDVITGIERKLIFRHPHIFGDKAVSDANEVIKNWEVLKAQERRANNKAQGLLRSVPKGMSALSLAQAYQKRAARVGFDWESIEPVKQKIDEELQEVEKADRDEERAKELGDVLFAMVNLIRWYGQDAESVLREAAEKFASRFEYIEDCVQKSGKTFADFSAAELDAFWEDAKKR